MDDTFESLLNATQAARILNVSKPTAYNLAKEGLLPCIRWDVPGKNGKMRATVRFEPSALKAFIDKHRVNEGD